jgi:flagellar hook-associated protein 2
MASTNVITSLGAADVDTKELAANLVAATKEPRQKLIDAERKKAEVAISSTGMLKSGLTALQDAAAEIASVSKLSKIQVSSSNSAVVTGTSLPTATAKPGNYAIKVERLAAPTRMIASFPGTAGYTLPDPTSITLSVNGGTPSSVPVGGKTPSQVVDAINNWAKINAPDANFSATLVDTQSGDPKLLKVILQGEPDTADTFTVSASTDDPSPTGVKMFPYPADGARLATTAQLTVNGVLVERPSNRVTDVVTGLAIDLRATSAAESTISVVSDPDSVIKEIQNFIDTYNTVTEFLKKATGPKVVGDEIAGSLQNDSTARSVLAQLRVKVTAKFSELSIKPISITHLSTLGIAFDRNGVLKFEKPERFKEAYSQKPAEVITALSNDGVTLDPTTIRPSGLFGDIARLSNSMIRNSVSTVPRMSAGYEEKLTRIDKKQQALDSYILRITEQYDKQFSALNAALSSFKSTQSQLEKSLNLDNNN